MKKLLTFLAIAAAASSASAFVEFDNYYASFHGDWIAHHSDMDFGRFTDEQKSGSVKREYDLRGGYGFGGAVGASMDQFRLEAELFYKRNGINYGKGSSDLNTSENPDFQALETKVPGSIRHIGLMLNGYYDIPVTEMVTYYVGAGIGVDFQRFKRAENFFFDSNGNPAVGSSDALKSSKSAFAAQFMTGLAYEFSDTISLSLGYRLFGAGKAVKEWNDDATQKNQKLRRLPLNHSVEFGLRYYIF